MRWMLTILTLTLLFGKTVNAEEPELVEVNATIYCSGTTTADGSPIREGICAVAPEHIGETVLIYTLDRELLGIWEAKDTGGESVKKGNVIDVYFESEKAGKEFIDRTYENGAMGKVLVQYVPAAG
ncbi:MAG: hypothetical protein E7300_00860 [Lachnospiraceae bacterium]|nr:hypothetical protein [Lachnospiraceae bacterium]